MGRMTVEFMGRTLTVPRPRKDDLCGRCGNGPVAFAGWHTGGAFTPPPAGVWVFYCAACNDLLTARGK